MSSSESNGHDKHIGEEQQKWLESKYARAVEKGGERKDTDFRTSSTDVAPLYTPADVASIDYNEDIGFPGEYPYTRGVQATMYRGKEWSIRQYAGYGTPAETNERFKFLLSEGQPGLSVAFDLPTQLGYDSDDPLAEGEVGKVGVAIDTLADMETMFEGIPLDRVSTSMTINAPASVLVAMYAVVGQKQGVPQDRIAGTAQNDVLKEYVARGTYIYPPKQSLRLAADLMAYCARELPRFNAISISGYHIRDAGSTAVQEMAFTFANAVRLRRSGARARRRRRRHRPAHLLDLQHPEQLPGRSGEVPSAAPHVGAHHEGALQRTGPALDDAAHSCADRRRDADRTAAGGEHRPRGAAGAGHRARRRAVARAVVLRRGARPADGAGAADRRAHAAGDRVRERRH